MRAQVGIAVLATTACAEPELEWFETEHLRVRGHDGADLCAGTPALLEREVVRLADALGLPAPEHRIDVLIGPDAARNCAAGYAGCAGRADNGHITVASPHEVVGHELVHAVRLSAASYGPSFYEEGLAEVYSAGAMVAHEVPEVSVDASALDALQLEKLADAGDYVIATSFVAWLRDQTDTGTFVDAFAGPPFADIASRGELDPWFMAAFGRSLAAAETEWVAAAPPARVLPGPCVVNEPITTVAGHYEEEGRLDCDDPGTLGPWSPSGNGTPDVRSLTRCLDVQGAEQVVLAIDGPPPVVIEARLRRCDTHEIAVLEFAFGGQSKELAIEPDHCWLDLRVTGSVERVADYRWTLELR